MDAKNSNQKLIYLYCVTKAKPLRTNFNDFGIKIYPIYSQGTYAIVSKVSSDEFNEDNLKKNLADMKWVEERVQQHERIIEEIMRGATVLPFKFGTIFQSEENLQKTLKEHGTEFKKTIADLEGKEEWGLKIYCDLEKFEDLIIKEDEILRGLDEEIVSASKGKAYFLKKEKEKLKKDIMSKKISEYTKDSFEKLERISVKAKINKILPKEVTQKNEDMVFNGAFLIDKKRMGEFNSVVEYLRTAYSGKGLVFDCTGPWPPYNFCEVTNKGTRSG